MWTLVAYRRFKITSKLFVIVFKGTMQINQNLHRSDIRTGSSELSVFHGKAEYKYNNDASVSFSQLLLLHMAPG